MEEIKSVAGDVLQLPTLVQNDTIVDLVSPVSRRISENNFSFSDRERGWNLVRRRIPQILAYGRKEKILGEKISTKEKIDRQTENAKLKKLTDDEGSSNADSLIHSAIPCLPVPAAAICCVLNFILPGSGTVLSGLCCICMGQSRIKVREGKVVLTLIVNTLVAVCQLGTVTFFFVGWFWSMAWGGLMLMHAIQHRDAIIKKRQIVVATAAIEALTNNALLRRRKVQSLVEDQRNNSNNNNNISNTDTPSKHDRRSSSMLENIFKFNAQEQIHLDSPVEKLVEMNLIVETVHVQPSKEHVEEEQEKVENTPVIDSK